LAPEPVSPDYVFRNRTHWDNNAPEWIEMGRRAWSHEPSWGIWGVPETELQLLPPLEGRAALEIGCGTGYVSAWLARAGARPIGLDSSGAQLATAATLQAEYDLRFPLIHGVGEYLPFGPETFDLVISEYGSAIWSDPRLWIPEAARVLRAGGHLVFLANSILFMLVAPELDGVPAETTLLRQQFGIHRFEWPDDDAVEFHLSHGDMIALLRSTGFEILDLVEIQAPEGSPETRFNVPREWALRWPSEEVWRVRKR